MLSPYLSFQILLRNVFPKEPKIWFEILVAGLRIILPEAVSTSILHCFRTAVQLSREIWSRTSSVVLTRCLCSLFLTFAMIIKLSLWFAVFTVLSSGKDGRYGFKISRKHWRYVATGLKPRTTYFVNDHSAILASLAKWLSVCLRTKWFWVRIQLQSLKRQILRLLRARTWYSGNCRVRIHSETHTWHDKDIQSEIGVCFVC